MAQAPDHFDLFGGEGEGFGNVDIGREGFYAGNCGLLGGRSGGVW